MCASRGRSGWRPDLWGEFRGRCPSGGSRRSADPSAADPDVHRWFRSSPRRIIIAAGGLAAAPAAIATAALLGLQRSLCDPERPSWGPRASTGGRGPTHRRIHRRGRCPARARRAAPCSAQRDYVAISDLAARRLTAGNALGDPRRQFDAARPPPCVSVVVPDLREAGTRSPLAVLAIFIALLSGALRPGWCRSSCPWSLPWSRVLAVGAALSAQIAGSPDQRRLRAFGRRGASPLMTM